MEGNSERNDFSKLDISTYRNVRYNIVHFYRRLSRHVPHDVCSAPCTAPVQHGRAQEEEGEPEHQGQVEGRGEEAGLFVNMPVRAISEYACGMVFTFHR